MIVGFPTVTVGATVCPIPASLILIEDNLLSNTTACAFVTAVVPLPVGSEIVTNGGLELEYPTPSSTTVKLITPLPVVSISAVAAAPTPPVPVFKIVTNGGVTYPEPALVSRISLIDLTPPMLVVIATAVALTPPDGAVEIATVGAVL